MDSVSVPGPTRTDNHTHRPHSHRKFRVVPPADTELKHTDQCIENARKYGFCEHTELPLLSTRHRRGRSRKSQCRFLAVFGLAIVVLCTLALVQRVGWVALPYVTGLGIGWLAIFLLGLPAWFTFDLSKILPHDTRTREQLGAD